MVLEFHNMVTKSGSTVIVEKNEHHLGIPLYGN